MRKGEVMDSDNERRKGDGKGRVYRVFLWFILIKFVIILLIFQSTFVSIYHNIVNSTKEM